MTRAMLKARVKFKDQFYQLRIIVEAPPHEREDILRTLENELLQRGVMV